MVAPALARLKLDDITQELDMRRTNLLLEGRASLPIGLDYGGAPRATIP